MGDTISQSALERFEVREVLDAYTANVNLREFAAAGALFVPDGVWEVRGVADTPRRIQGSLAIGDAIARAVGAFARLVQMNHAPLIRVNGDRATASSTIHEMGKAKDGSDIFLLGRYTDDIVRVDGAWRFQTRQFDALYLDRSPLAGSML